jgi:O-antigen/teichoic acid export membrane protein
VTGVILAENSAHDESDGAHITTTGHCRDDVGCTGEIGRRMPPPASMKARAVRGSMWTLGGYGSSQVLRLGSHLVLAWLLAPEVFGLMALVKVVMHGLAMFSDVGIRPAIIQSPRGKDPAFLNTAWTIQVIRGFALWICACLLALPFAALFARSDPAAWQLAYILPAAGFVAVFQGFNSTALATLNKELRLRRVTLLALSAQIVSLTVMVGWALVHRSVWAMVAGGLAGSLFTMIMSHRLVRGHAVALTLDRKCVGALMRFGRWVFLSTVLTFLALNFDRFMLANLLTLGELGLYSIAFVLCRVALHITDRLSGTVLFPVFSEYNQDERRMVSVALRAREVVLWVGVSVSICIAVASPLFFKTLWDDRYHGAGSIAQWLSLFVWAMITLSTVDRIPLAMGNTRALFYSNVWRMTGIGAAVFGYYANGLSGFIAGLAFGPIAAQLYIVRHIPARGLELLKQGVRFTIGGLLYGVPSMLIVNGLGKRGDDWREGVTVVILACIPVTLAAWKVRRRIRRSMDVESGAESTHVDNQRSGG